MKVHYNIRAKDHYDIRAKDHYDSGSFSMIYNSIEEIMEEALILIHRPIIVISILYILWPITLKK